MPKPGGRGGKKSHKGQRRHFTSEDEIRAQQEKEEKEKQWRKQRGIESDESDDEEGGASQKAAASKGAPGDLPPSDSESEGSSDEESDKPKGVEHLIDIQNPNRTGARTSKKISELNEDGKTQLSRREKEELAKQQAAARYRKLHLEGKTDEAQADLARLALIRKQRADAAVRREEEQKAKAAKEAQKKAANK